MNNPINIPQLANYLDTDIATVCDLIAESVIPTITIDGFIRISAEYTATEAERAQNVISRRRIL